jgi:RNA recognition motif-containing protein
MGGTKKASHFVEQGISRALTKSILCIFFYFKDNQHRGFAFVEFEEPQDAQAAIDNMHLAELYGKVIKVNLARPIRLKEGSMRAGKRITMLYW